MVKDEGDGFVQENMDVEDETTNLPSWARKFLAKPSAIQENFDADLPKWARGRFSR